ncbi:D-alanine--D-alanine ligase family protein [Microvirga arsenatis]|uniref:D-alanine--D-alanine ligase n=1 Tax=Microvirga arsenatis TaxID=2692265 RepID=A0ABW9YRL3_9HYPH|nr:D-alanine--D-alanine ligase family protein [Microvirga arsenatis]NBJ09834.1 D-alanine--D-alanine ligase [Microvirga arsenatis]NBJ22902.1 D-alanine--D-alanine ligase [Microvirga arsenatis]
MMQPRKTIGLLFGGRSAEHEVSKLSAANVLRALDPDRYDIVPIGIGRDGRWLLCDSGNGGGRGAKSLEIPEGAPQVALLPGGAGEMIVLGDESGPRTLRLDAVVPVLHGPNGEDGTIQGCLELANVPYVGSGVLGSAAGMDKDVAKRLLRDSGLPVVPFLTLTPRTGVDYRMAVQALGTPDLFVKPANMGSSVGVSRARSAQEFGDACERAFRYDSKVLVERSVAGAREIECSVLEDAAGEIKASPLGEIVPADSHGFYSYDAKYIDTDGALLRVPAELPAERARRIQELAVETFKVLACEGLARVDFFLDPKDEGSLFVNEVNTLPGFTAISMYPKLWEAGGLPQGELMEVLIGHAIARHERRNRLALV